MVRVILLCSVYDVYLLFPLGTSDPLLTAKKAREREQKWLRMLQKWDEWVEHKQSRVSQRL